MEAQPGHPGSLGTLNPSHGPTSLKAEQKPPKTGNTSRRPAIGGKRKGYSSVQGAEFHGNPLGNFRGGPWTRQVYCEREGKILQEPAAINKTYPRQRDSLDVSEGGFRCLTRCKESNARSGWTMKPFLIFDEGEKPRILEAQQQKGKKTKNTVLLWISCSPRTEGGVTKCSRRKGVHGEEEFFQEVLHADSPKREDYPESIEGTGAP